MTKRQKEKLHGMVSLLLGHTPITKEAKVAFRVLNALIDYSDIPDSLLELVESKIRKELGGDESV